MHAGDDPPARAIYYLPSWQLVTEGAALGETGKPFPRRNRLQGFEDQPFLTRITADGVEFGDDGRHQDLLRMIAPGRRAMGGAAAGPADRRTMA
ncbi:MAG: hypothetical protein FJW14_16085 [Acidimicrobiia bacterium]|nr:hypothetical protein [Acidimicrobiia bacterium]